VVICRSQGKQAVGLVGNGPKTREIVGVYIGERSQEGQKLVEFLPPVYRQCAVCYTDFGSRVLVFFRRHKRVGKGLTNHIERFNNSLRQRISRLVRKLYPFLNK